ncbi:MAG TPA: NAD(P)-dependent oxidoreductase [Candidatus Polarisedimenticolia bacterium]|nr:NAD(P)-dependent oxidoreductase [Candidatus Polarisedimenticolia bacterium]
MSAAAGLKVGFIGLGIMGRPMAGHLLKAGHPLAVWNRTPGKSAELAAAGARVATSAADAAKGADIVIVMVTDSADVEAVIAGPGGILEGIQQGALVVDMSTISPQTERRMADLLRARGADLIDAPVSGGDVGARNATLAIMAGGAAAAVERARPVLMRLGKSVTHCGPIGAGQLAKLCNQILVSVNLLAVSEAIALARTGGLDPEVMLKAVEGGAAASWQLSNLGPRILRGDFDPGFMVDLMQKDLRLVLETAASSGKPLPATVLVHGLFGNAQANGEGRMGTQILGKVVDRLADGGAG